MIVTITDISSDGKGIGRTEEGLVVFVPGTVPGDNADIEFCDSQGKSGIKNARLIRITVPSPDRIEAPCLYHKECGGCPLMCVSYKAQLRIKTDHVKNALERIGGFKDGEDYVLRDILHIAKNDEMPIRYRNKAEFAIKGNRIGYLKRGSHDLLEIDDCLIQKECVGKVLAEKKAQLRSTQKYFKRLIVRTAEDGEIMTITENSDGTVTADRRVLHDEIQTAQSTLKTEVSPLSFYQVNPKCCSLLYSKAQEYAALTGTERLLDLYCGAGSIGLSMASKCSRVIGVESVKPAVLDANRNAVINGIVNATFICGKAEEVIDTKLQGLKADIVVVDPPRAGCDKSLLTAIRRIAPQRLIYVSCDPATLARDLKILCNAATERECGFKLIEATPVDMFPGSLHVETVALLRREKVDGYVDINLDVEKLEGKSGTATYKELKAYIEKKYGFKISTLFIAQIKDKVGLEKRKKYNPGSGKGKIPVCTPEKEEAIMDAFQQFNLI